MSAAISVGGTYYRIEALSPMDVRWLNALSHGIRVKELPGTSEQTIKNRLEKIRVFLDSRTTTEAVSKAIRRGIIK